MSAAAKTVEELTGLTTQEVEELRRQISLSGLGAMITTALADPTMAPMLDVLCAQLGQSREAVEALLDA